MLSEEADICHALQAKPEPVTAETLGARSFPVIVLGSNAQGGMEPKVYRNLFVPPLLKEALTDSSLSPEARDKLSKQLAAVENENVFSTEYQFLIPEQKEGEVLRLLKRQRKVDDTGAEGLRKLSVKRLSPTEQKIHVVFESDENIYQAWYLATPTHILPERYVFYWEPGIFMNPLAIVLAAAACIIGWLVARVLTSLLERLWKRVRPEN